MAALVYGNVSIGTSAAVISAASRYRDQGILVQNAHASNILYVGTDSSVTTSNGLKIGAGESLLIPGNDVVYGIASGASTDVRFMAV